MPRLMAAIYDRFMARTEEACLAAWRREVLGHARGDVLEVGAGTGANLGKYPDAVASLVLCEPDLHMRAQLEHKIRSSDPTHPESNAHVLDASAEALPFEDERFDAVVSTLVLCSVRSPALALAEMHRVLRPGGVLVFLEHVVAEGNPGREAWQRRLEPLWKQVADNCHVTRDTAASIEAAGFEMVDYTRTSMRKALPIVRPCIRGAARRG